MNAQLTCEIARQIFTRRADNSLIACEIRGISLPLHSQSWLHNNIVKSYRILLNRRGAVPATQNAVAAPFHTASASASRHFLSDLFLVAIGSDMRFSQPVGKTQFAVAVPRAGFPVVAIWGPALSFAQRETNMPLRWGEGCCIFAV